MAFAYNLLDKPAATVLSDVRYDFILDELHTGIIHALRRDYKELWRETIKLYEGRLVDGIEVRVIVLARSAHDEWLVYCPKGDALCIAMMSSIQEVHTFKNCVNYRYFKKKPSDLVRLVNGTQLTPSQIFQGIELHRVRHAP